MLAAVVLAGCGGSGSSSGTGSGGSGATGGVGGAAGSGVGGSAGAGGSAGSAGGSGGAGGSGANDGWYATTEWTSLPIPLQFGPTMASHPTAPSEFTVLASAYSGMENQVVAATTNDLGTSFSKAKLSILPQTAMAEPKGVAYNPKNPLELAAIVWIQGQPTDPESGGHLFRSTDGGKSFVDTGMAKSLPMNALAFSRVRYTSDGLIAIRTGSSVVYSADGSTTSDTVDTPGCSTSPGNAAFDVSPTDGKQVAVPCGNELAICTKSGCTKSSSSDGVADVAFGTDAQHVAAIARGTDGSMSALVSEDGGKTFSVPKVFKENISPSWRVDWDPRPGKHIVYALLYSHLFQSSDGGKTWLDVTPPQALNYLYDFVVAADGTLIGLGVFHYLVRPPVG